MDHEQVNYWAEKLVERSMKLARQVARRMGYRDGEEAESLALERLTEGLNTYTGPRDEEQVWLWVKRCIRNGLKDLVEHEDVKFVPGNEPEYPDAASQAEAAENMDVQMKRLPRKYREVVGMRMRGWSYQEIAEALSISEDAARQRALRGTEMLADFVTKRPA